MVVTKQSSTKGSKSSSNSVPEKRPLFSSAAAATLPSRKQGSKKRTGGIAASFKSTSDNMADDSAADMDTPPAIASTAAASFKSTSDNMADDSAADMDTPPAIASTAAASFKSTSDNMADDTDDAPPAIASTAAASFKLEGSSRKSMYTDSDCDDVSIEKLSDESESGRDGDNSSDSDFDLAGLAADPSGKATANQESDSDDDYDDDEEEEEVDAPGRTSNTKGLVEEKKVGGNNSTRKLLSQKQIEAKRKHLKKSTLAKKRALNKEHGLQLGQLLGALVDNPDFRAAQWQTAHAFNGEIKDVVYLTMADDILTFIETSQQRDELAYSDLTRESQLVTNLHRIGFHIVKEVSRTEYEGPLPPSGSKWRALMWHPLFQRLPNGMVDQETLAALVAKGEKGNCSKTPNPFIDPTEPKVVKKRVSVKFNEGLIYLGKVPEHQVEDRKRLAKEALRTHQRDHPNATQDEFEQMLKDKDLKTKKQPNKERGEMMRAAGIQTKEKNTGKKKKSSAASKNSKKKKSSAASKNSKKKKSSS